MNKNKKAYVRTLEVLIALLLTFLFLALFIPKYYSADIRTENLGIVKYLKDDSTFRNCVLGEDATCIDTRIRQHLPNSYDYTYSVSADPNYMPTGLPDKRVFAESGYFAGNLTEYNPKIFRLYYWSR